MPDAIAAVWRSGGAVSVGRAEVLHDRLRLTSGRAGHEDSRDIRLTEIAGARLVRHPADERIDGRPTLIVSLTQDQPLLISAVFGIGVLTELAERLGGY